MKNKDKNISIKFNVLVILTIIIFSFAIAPITLQNDTYYTIKIGELIVQNGIDMQDHFSWHEDLPYTYPHWAYDTGIYLIYHLGEITGIPNGGMTFIYVSTIILTVILGILIYCTCNKVSKNKLVSFILTIGTIYFLKDFIAARAQLVTFSLFILTIFLIESFIESSKKKYLLGIVLVAIVIANVHVAVWPFFFILFLPYIAEYLICVVRDLNIIAKIEILICKINKNKLKNKENAKEKIELLNKKINAIKEKVSQEKTKETYKITMERKDIILWLIIVMLICIFTGFLTPLGDTPFTYLIQTMQGNTTKSINEHLPLTLYNDPKTMIVLTVVLAILIFTDTKIKLRDFFMIAGLTFLAFMSRRQISLMVLLGVPVLAKMISSLFKKYDKDGSEKIVKLMSTLLGRTITIAIIALLSFAIFKPKIEDKFINEKIYPEKASQFILENLDINNIKLFNGYNYGSYLLFKGIPVFIDSRADLYAPEFNGKIDENGELKGRDIFTDYMNVSSIGTYYENKFEEYEITHIIINKNAKLNMLLSRDEKYKQLYIDDYFVIYERGK